MPLQEMAEQAPMTGERRHQNELANEGVVAAVWMRRCLPIGSNCSCLPRQRLTCAIGAGGEQVAKRLKVIGLTRLSRVTSKPPFHAM